MKNSRMLAALLLIGILAGVSWVYAQGRGSEPGSPVQTSPKSKGSMPVITRGSISKTKNSICPPGPTMPSLRQVAERCGLGEKVSGSGFDKNPVRKALLLRTTTPVSWSKLLKMEPKDEATGLCSTPLNPNPRYWYTDTTSTRLREPPKAGGSRRVGPCEVGVRLDGLRNQSRQHFDSGCRPIETYRLSDHVSGDDGGWLRVQREPCRAELS